MSTPPLAKEGAGGEGVGFQKRGEGGMGGGLQHLSDSRQPFSLVDFFFLFFFFFYNFHPSFSAFLDLNASVRTRFHLLVA